MRSRTGCLTCRQRKLKCDERKPICSQCTKANRECRYGEGIVFRHQQNASMNGPAGSASTGNSLGRFYSYKNTFDESSIWVPVPKKVTFVDNSDPYNQDLDDVPVPHEQDPTLDHDSAAWNLDGVYQSAALDLSGHGIGMPTHGLEALSAAATRDQYSAMAPTTESSIARSAISYAQNQLSSAEQSGKTRPTSSPPPDLSTSPSNQINFLLNPPNATSPPIDPNLHADIGGHDSFLDPALSAQDPSQPLKTDAAPERDHEVAFLLRHFSETPGQWMDLFDFNSYFSSFVPIKSLSSSLLRYSACAYAAKQLARVGGMKTDPRGSATRQIQTGVWPDLQKVDWYFYAAKYYDQAIQLLMDFLQQDDEILSQLQLEDSHSSPITIPNAVAANDNQDHTSLHVPEEVLIATPILAAYEFLDASATAWSRHLNGTKLLIEMTLANKLNIDRLSSANLSSMQVSGKIISKAQYASFWNFARQDMMAAFINETFTRFDTEDLSIWREAGLLIDDDGFVQSRSFEVDDQHEQPFKEDMLSNALVWLLSRIINFLAVGDDVYVGESTPENSPRFGVTQERLLARWKRLSKELDTWFSGLPDTFRPTTRVDGNPFPEIWYNIPMCASTMQHWHMAKILLAINKPHESTARRSTVTSRLLSYQTISEELKTHGNEICGISLSRPEGSVRIHSLQPLFVAGQAIVDSQGREVILELLRGIEIDLGWATEYRVRQLQQQWSET